MGRKLYCVDFDFWCKLELCLEILVEIELGSFLNIGRQLKSIYFALIILLQFQGKLPYTTISARWWTFFFYIFGASSPWSGPVFKNQKFQVIISFNIFSEIISCNISFHHFPTESLSLYLSPFHSLSSSLYLFLYLFSLYCVSMGVFVLVEQDIDYFNLCRAC